jgi:hypothetical protein
MTPAGPVPIHIYGHLPANFDFHIGHTNFTIDEAAQRALTAVEGVETLDVMTRYRFRVGIGLAFEGEKVRRGIEAALNARRPFVPPLELDDEAATKLSLLGEAGTASGKFWAAYLVPNGSLDVFRTDDRAAYEARLDLYIQARGLAGGIIRTSDDELRDGPR